MIDYVHSNTYVLVSPLLKMKKIFYFESYRSFNQDRDNLRKRSFEELYVGLIALCVFKCRSLIVNAGLA